MNTNKSTNVRARKKKRPSLSARVRKAGFAAARDSISWLSRQAPELALPLAAHLFVSTQRFQAKPAERAALKGARAVKLRRDEHELAGWVWGASGPIVLLVHGWNGRASQMGTIATRLAKQGYRAVAFDLSGHGQSSGRQATAVSLAEDVLHIAEVMGPVYGVVTHSFGGAVTTLALLAGLPVKRAVYVAPPLESRRWFELFVEMMRIDPAMVPALKQRLEQRVGIAFEELNGALMAPAMDVPLLIIHDHDDSDVPISAGETLAQLWPDAQFVATTGLGHQRILRDDDVTQKITDFISNR